MYWGYNPHAHGETDVDNLDGNNPDGNDNNLTNEGPLDGGVPLADALKYIQDLAALDFVELGLIDVDADTAFPDVSDISLTNNGDGTQTISVTQSDGTVNSAEVALGEMYFELLYNALYDAEGNSRLYEVQVPYMVAVEDAEGNALQDSEGNDILVPAVIEGNTIVTVSPIYLTPTQNNGGTEELGYTSSADDLIVAARLELLHGAYIDGGAGENTLEIDAKGHFAQPKQLLNIQNIKIENLPNIYTTTDADGNIVNDYSDIQEGGAADPDSIIDLSRAGDIATLTITEGNFEGLAGQVSAGELTVAGIRNGAVTTLDGGFTQDVTLHYGELQGAGVQLIFNNLSMGDVEGNGTGPQLTVANNAEELTIETTGGNSFLANADLGGQLTTLTITGTEHLHIDGDLDSSFQNETPVTIDASGNTGGVDLELSNSEQVTFIGSSANDRFNVSTSSVADDFSNDESVVIQGGEGNNYYVVDTYMATITNGDGNNNYEVDFDKGTLTAGDGNNFIEGSVVNFTATLGDGDNYVELDAVDATDSSELGIEDFPTAVNLTLGNGANEINVDAGTGEDASVIVVAGDGGNNIEVSAADVSLTTGAGNDVIDASGNSITIDSGAGNDTITIDGQDDDYVTESDNTTAATNGVLLNINTGTGSAVINLGRDTDNADDGVNSDNATLTAKEGSVITGEDITLVVKTDADLRVADLSGITSVILDDDGATGGNGQGYTDSAAAGAAVLTLTDEQFTAIGADAFSVEGSSFGAHAVVEIVVTESTSLTDLGVESLGAGVKLKLYVEDGVTLTMTAEQLHKYVTADGVIQAQPAVNYEAPGKLIITDAGFNFAAGTNNDGTIYSGDAGTVAQGFGSTNVQIQRTADGYERPAPTPSTDDFFVQNGDTINNFERVYDATFDANTDIAQWMNVIADEPGARININITDGATVGNAAGGIENGGIHSQNVSTFVVTGINTVGANDGDALKSQSQAATATVYVCDSTEGVEVLGLQNNREATITFNQVNWGTELLLEGDGYANASEQEKALGNPDLSEVGAVVANFFEPGANAVVNINNQGVELGMNEDAEDGYDANGERVLDVAGITLTNADRVVINVEDGDAVVHNFVGTDIERIFVNGSEDVTLEVAATGIDANDLKSIDATGVTDLFTLNLTDGNYNLSEVVMTGIDSMVLGNGTAAVDLTLSADQVVDLGGVIADTDSATELNVVELSDQALDLTTVDVDNIGTVTFADVDGTIVVDAATNFGDATSVIILAEDSDTAVEMTAAQFGTITGGTVDVTETGTNDATLVLTDLASDETLTLNNVDGNADVVLRVSDLVATEDMVIVEDGDVDSITLEVTGTVDLTEADLTGVDINNVDIAAGATLTLTAAQALAIGIDDANTDGVADNWTGTGTLNIIDLSTQALDLDKVADAGITIGTISIKNTDAAITIDGGTTFGGATEIITPTAEAGSPDFGTENTTVTMSVDQFLSSAGLISGDSQINLTGLYNNVDTDSDFVVDSANFDFSGIANAGTITFAADTDGAAGTDDNVITLTDTADLGGFTVALGNGDLIRFATEAQAGRAITAEASPSVSGVQWLWTVFGAEVDTSEYDSDITTLFIDEALLVSQPIEENLWTSLDGSIVVEKINGDTIPELVKYDRVNTFEAFTNIGAGINYDDDAAFGTVANLTMNLEGEVNLGNILLGDTNNGDGSTPNIDGVGFFETLVINSYKDLTNVDGYDPLSNDVPGRVIETNYLGDISLNAGSVDDLVNITINTYGDVDNVIGTLDDANGYLDAENVNGAEAERDGMAIEVGTITFGSSTEQDALLTLTGAEDITLGGVDISDADISLLTIDANAHSGDLEIGGIAPTGGLNDFGEIYVVDGHTAEAGDAIGDAADGAEANDLLVVTNGDNDLTEAILDIEAVHVTGDATLTLTAAQITAIGEGNFSVVAGANVTLNVTELGNAAINLNTIQDAGFNIGVVSTVEDSGAGAINTVLNAGTTLGGADELRVLLNDEDNTLTLTASQYLQLNGGNITEVDSDGTTANSADVTITDLVDASNRVDIPNPNDDDRWSVNLDLSTVATTGTHTLEVADTNTAADVTIDSTSDLSDFIVQLNDVDDADANNLTPNELAGQTVRFTTEAQAGRQISVTGYDSDGAQPDGRTEADTNVVWEFDTVTGPINTSLYDSELGRLWVSDELVKSDNDLEDLFSASDLNGNSLQDDINLNGNIIVRIVNTQNLALIDFQSQGVNRTVEIEAYTDLSATGLVFDEQDQLVDVQNLTLDLGGNVQLGDLVIDNIIQTTNTDLDSDQFGTLIINSYLANAPGHYLLPEDFVAGTNVYPTGANVIGDISAPGTAANTRGELTTVVVNATDVDVVINEILFSEEDTAGAPAEFEVNGGFDVTVKSLDTSDAGITSLTVDNNMTGGTLLVTGGSPAFGGGAVGGLTETLTIESVATATTTFGSDKAAPATGEWAGIYGETLSLIDLSGAGTVNLGTIAGVDTEDFTITTNAATVGSDLTAFTGTVNLTLGEADADGLTAPELSATGTWVLDFTGATANVTITDDVTFNAGGQLAITNATLDISSAVNLAVLGDGLTLTDVTIDVPAGASLTLTPAQADTLTITGEGDVIITTLDAAAFNAAAGVNGDLDLSGIMTGTGDTGTVSLAIDSTGDIDLQASDLGVAAVAITGTGSVNATGATLDGADRADTAADVSDDTYPSFTVGTGSTLQITATQAGNASGTAANDYALTATGLGTVAVGDLGTNPDADLSGLATTSVTATVEQDTEFTGDLGTAVVTVFNGSTLTADYSIVTGKTINEQAAPAGTGALVVDIAAANAAADLSTITSDMDAVQITANFVEDMTFTGNLDDHNATVGTDVADVDLVVSAAIISGLTVTTADADDSIHIPDLATNLTADLSGIAGAGAETAAFDADGTFTGDLGTVNVTVADDVTMTAAASILSDAIVNKSGSGSDNGAIAVTLSNAVAGDATVNLTTIPGQAGDNAGVTDAPVLASVTVLNDLTFTGTLINGVQVADGATLTVAADVIDGITVDAAGTTGAVTIDATTVTDANLNLAGSANYTVNTLTDTLTATGVTGSLSVVTGDANLAIALGAGTNTIDGDALTAGNTITVTGSDTSATVTTENGNINASGVTNVDADTTTGGLTLNGGDGQNTITGGANDDVINGGVDADNMVGGAGDDTFVIDAALDVVAGEIIDGGADTDTVQINTTLAIDLSLVTSSNLEILDLSNVDADVTITGAQLQDFSGANGLVQANASDDLTIDTLSGLTVDATNAADNFIFGAADVNTEITSYTTGTDEMDFDARLDGITKVYEEIANDGADIATDANVIVVGGASDIGTVAALAAADATVTGADGLLVFSDGTDTFVYYTDDLANDGTETLLVTLAGITDATSLATTDFIFA